MVLILTHVIVASYYEFRDRQRSFYSRKTQEMGISEGLQEAILRLSGVLTFDQLEDTVKEALKLTLPNVTDAIVYLQLHDGQDLVSTQGLLHTLPKEGLAREAVQKKERVQIDGLADADPLAGLLSTGTSPIESKRKVVCSPVIERETDNILAVLVVVSNQLSTEDHHNLDFIEKQLLVCFKRLKQTTQINSNGGPQTVIVNHQSTHTQPNANAILSLCADLYDHDAEKLQQKIVKYLCHHTQAQSGLLLTVAQEVRELACQVIGDEILGEELRFAVDSNCFSKVIKTKNAITHSDMEPEQLAELEKIVGLKVESLLCVPLCRRVSGDVAAMACMLNKANGSRFTDKDVETIRHCFVYTATVLNSTFAVQNERKMKNQTETMLQVAKNLFTHLDDLTILLREIMQEARNLTQAERCSVFLMENQTNELVAKVFDGDIRAGKEVKLQSEVRIPANQGIAGHVATTGEILNIDDAYSHDLFYRGVDDSTGFRTRNILCFPIKNEKGEIIGVAQLCNKMTGGGFSKFDEKIVQAFSVYCCIGIVHSLLYKKVADAQIRSKLASELMIFHMQVEETAVARLKLVEIPTPKSFHVDMDQFCFTPRTIPYDETPVAVLSMFEDMNLISRFRIGRDVLARFVLMVRKGYRDPPYHNWNHAFAVAHFCYIMYKNANLMDYVDDIELLSLFTSCLVHDIDHRGTTSSYQVASGSVLAALYSSEGSVMERHHFAQSMCILNTDGCNIFENLTTKEYERVLDLMRDIILATDLAHHLRIIKDMEKMADDGYNKENPEHRMLTLCLLMTSCDLSDQTKNWQNSKKIAELIYNEFFSQGDLEKALGRKPMEMMDREKACIPQLQIGFLRTIALPVFRILAKVFPSAQEVLNNVENNHKQWSRVNHIISTKKLVQNSSMDIFEMDLDLDTEESTS